MSTWFKEKKKMKVTFKTEFDLKANYDFDDNVGPKSHSDWVFTSDGCSLAVEGIKNNGQPTSVSAPDLHSKTASHTAETMPRTRPNPVSTATPSTTESQ